MGLTFHEKTILPEVEIIESRHTAFDLVNS